MIELVIGGKATPGVDALIDAARTSRVKGRSTSAIPSCLQRMTVLRWTLS